MTRSLSLFCILKTVSYPIGQSSLWTRYSYTARAKIWIKSLFCVYFPYFDIQKWYYELVLSVTLDRLIWEERDGLVPFKKDYIIKVLCLGSPTLVVLGTNWTDYTSKSEATTQVDDLGKSSINSTGSSNIYIKLHFLPSTQAFLSLNLKSDLKGNF